MARFLFAWEIGAGLGHVLPLAQVAAPLVAQGHELHFVLRDLSHARAALGALADAPAVRLWQAPLWLPRYQSPQPSASYAELLFHAGYLEPVRLRGLVQAWRSLLDAVQPALLLADHAPTALLAARGLPLRRALIGNGFFLPPAQQPLPSLREWETVSPQRLAQGEGLVLASCNQVLTAEGRPPLSALHELLAADEHFLLTWPELDPYGRGPRGRGAGTRYWGALPVPTGGGPASWPEGPGPALFAYLKGDYSAIDAVLQRLAAAPCRTLAHVPGLTAAQRQRHQGTRLRISEGAVDMAQALAGAQAVLCHAGAGTVAASLQAGKPLLLLPMQGEQLLLARRVLACGAGLALDAAQVGPGLLPALAQLLGAAGPRDGAQALAARHAPVPGHDVAHAVAARCLALAATQGG